MGAVGYPVAKEWDTLELSFKNILIKVLNDMGGVFDSKQQQQSTIQNDGS